MYSCSTCGKEFRTAQGLGGHKGSHSRGERYRARRRGKWNLCLFCGETTKNQLYCSTEHRVLHRGQKRFKIYRYSAEGVFIHQELDVTNDELRDYRSKQITCEICGRAESTRQRSLEQPNQLSVDHCHNTLKFRGLLCSVCNRQLGWYERNKESIEKYLNKPV